MWPLLLKKHPVSHVPREMISASRSQENGLSLPVPTRNVIALQNMCNTENGKCFPLYRNNRTEYSFYVCTYSAAVAQSVERRGGWPAFDSRQERDTSLLSTASRPILGPAQPPVQSVAGPSGRDAKLTPHLHLMQRSVIVVLHLHPPYVFMVWCLSS